VPGLTGKLTCKLAGEAGTAMLKPDSHACPIPSWHIHISQDISLCFFFFFFFLSSHHR
jgi:hypothetical protein